MATVAIDTAAPRTASDPVWRMLTGAAVFGIGVFICGSVGSYVPTDPSWNVATDLSSQNLFGTTGAVFADLARQGLGWSSWTAGLAMMVGGAMRTVLIGRPSIRRWAMGTAFIPLSAACFAAWPVPASWPLNSGLGGVIGDSLLDLMTMPFKALLMPMPVTLAGLTLGSFAAWMVVGALGFGRADAHLLKGAAARSSVRAAYGAKGLGGAFFGFLSRFGRKPVSEPGIIIADDDYTLRPSQFLKSTDPEERPATPGPKGHAPVLGTLRPMQQREAPRVHRKTRRRSPKLPSIDILKIRPPARKPLMKTPYWLKRRVLQKCCRSLVSVAVSVKFALALSLLCSRWSPPLA